MVYSLHIKQIVLLTILPIFLFGQKTRSRGTTMVTAAKSLTKLSQTVFYCTIHNTNIFTILTQGAYSTSLIFIDKNGRNKNKNFD